VVNRISPLLLLALILMQLRFFVLTSHNPYLIIVFVFVFVFVF